ncbi:MAG: DNA repair protein RecO [Xenococcaceae cyanobacterium MO_188.B32]|nr:DNA repair protein RecO [Xenococcaceae cyanobacterium MO_188.B32]
MSQTYKATGINLKGSPLGETDRLVTVLTSEWGIVRAIAPGARKYKSRLRGRSELFVVNNLLIVKGRSLDKIIQADTIYTYPGLSQDLGKLATAQYLAELVLYLALSEQSQLELYELFNEHLRRIEQLANRQNVYPYLAQAVYHILAIAGVAPQVQACCLSQKLLSPNFVTPNWQVGFSFERGSIVDLNIAELNNRSENNLNSRELLKFKSINYKVNALELTLLQQLSCEALPQLEPIVTSKPIESKQTQSLQGGVSLTNFSLDTAWIKVERILREYAQYYCGRSLRSADLVDNLYLVEF